jgi:hypothetical protein
VPPEVAAPAPAELPPTELEDEELPHFLPDFPISQSFVVPAAGSAPEPASGPPRSAPEASTPEFSSPWSPEPTTAPAASPPKAAEAGFGESIEGLKASNAALSRVRGLEGKAIRVTGKRERGTFAFYAAKRVVSKRAGDPYEARTYVRTRSPGMYLCLRVEERGSAVLRTTERCAPARSGWRRLALKGKTAGQGHKLVFSIHVIAAGGGTSFDVDGFKLG